MSGTHLYTYSINNTIVSSWSQEKPDVCRVEIFDGLSRGGLLVDL